MNTQQNSEAPRAANSGASAQPDTEIIVGRGGGNVKGNPHIAELLQEQEERACLAAEEEDAEPKKKNPRHGKPEPKEPVEGDW